MLQPSESTYRAVIAAVSAGTPVLWLVNNRIAIQFQPSVTSGPKVSVCNPNLAAAFSGLVVAGGNCGLAAAVNSDPSFGFNWNGQSTMRGQHSDDLAQAIVYNPCRPYLADLPT